MKWRRYRENSASDRRHGDNGQVAQVAGWANTSNGSEREGEKAGARGRGDRAASCKQAVHSGEPPPIYIPYPICMAYGICIAKDSSSTTADRSFGRADHHPSLLYIAPRYPPGRPYVGRALALARRYI